MIRPFYVPVPGHLPEYAGFEGQGLEIDRFGNLVSDVSDMRETGLVEGQWIYVRNTLAKVRGVVTRRCVLLDDRVPAGSLSTVYVARAIEYPNGPTIAEVLAQIDAVVYAKLPDPPTVLLKLIGGDE